MKIQVEKLKEEENQPVTKTENLEVFKIDYRGNKLDLPGGISAEVRAVYSDDIIQVTIDFQAKVKQYCSRCLKPIISKIERSEIWEFNPQANLDVDSRGEVSVYKYDGAETIDLLPYILGFIKLDLNPYPLCKEDCKGLCPNCGIDLNQNPDHECETKSEDQAKDPRLEKLSELL